MSSSSNRHRRGVRGLLSASFPRIGRKAPVASAVGRAARSVIEGLEPRQLFSLDSTAADASWFRVSLPDGGAMTQWLAGDSLSGSLSVTNGGWVKAASPGDAVKQVVQGTITNVSVSPNANFSFPTSDAFEVIEADKLHNGTTGVGRPDYEVRLEDRFGLPGDDGDYNDDYLHVKIEKWTASPGRLVGGSRGTSIAAEDPNAGSGAFDPTTGQSGTDTSGAVDLATGRLVYSNIDLASAGFGTGTHVGRVQTNISTLLPTNSNGTGVVNTQLPYLVRPGTTDDTIVAIDGPTETFFDLDLGSYTPRFFATDVLTHDATAHTFTRVDGVGQKLTFFDFDASVPAIKQGRIKQFADTNNNLTTYTYDGTSNQLTESLRSFTNGTVTVKERFSYVYVPTGQPNAGLVQRVSLDRKTFDTALGQSDASVAYTTIRAVEYAYYNSGDSYGDAGDLKFASILDPSVQRTGASIAHTTGASTATVTLSGHGYVNGDLVVLSGAADANFNGTFYVSGVNTNTFTIAVATGAGTSATATACTPIDVKYERYYTSADAGSIGYAHGLKFAFDARSYARLAASLTGGTTPTAASDGAVSAYASLYLEYDAKQRVSKRTVPGDGTYKYQYSDTPNTDPNPNQMDFDIWAHKTVTLLPDDTPTDDTDNDTQTTYTSEAAEVLLDVTTEHATGKRQATFYQYNTSGQRTLTAHPSAFQSFPSSLATLEANPDLLAFTAGSSSYLSNNSGLLETASYYTTTTASSTVGGGILGYLNQIFLKHGQTGTPIAQSAKDYTVRSAGGATVNPVHSESTFGAPGSGGGRIVIHEYTWNGDDTTGTTADDTTQPKTVTTTKPSISAGQNGPGTGSTSTKAYDGFGWLNWFKDAAGFLKYLETSAATGAVTKQIADVDTTRTSDFANLPAGWSTPSGGGLHLITTITTDGLGRPTKTIDPRGSSTYITTNDSKHETRTYAGWNTTTNLPTGPTQVSREYRPKPGSQNLLYTETLTTSATPATTGGVPTGTESIDDTNIQAFTRSISDSSGLFRWSDWFFDPAGLSGSWYTDTLSLSGSTPTEIGTKDTNYYRSQIDFSAGERIARTLNEVGTITRSLYDARGNLLSTWAGTDDTPTSGTWSPTNTAGTDLVKTLENEYDNGSEGGDGNLTRQTRFTGTVDNRVTDAFYDWRDRAVAIKAGVQGTEAASGQRTITYLTLNNLGEVTATSIYDGDGVNVTTTAGVPDQPSSTLLRSKTTADFDDQGRVYRTSLFSVDPSTGAVSSTSLKTDTWYDLRGNVIKLSEPGGLVTKAGYDGVSRTTNIYTTDGGGDSTYADASTRTGDKVLEQVTYTYDANSNVTLTRTKQRFHDETSTGDLGDASTTPKARVSYAAAYYDMADRTTATTVAGTNGGTAYAGSNQPPVKGVATSGSTTTLVDSSRTEATNAFNGFTIAIVRGTGSGQTRTVSSYNGSTKAFTVSSAFATSPDSTSRYLVYYGSDLTTLYTYNAAGNVQDVTDPKGIVTRSAYDLLNRTTSVTENYVDGTPSDADDRITRYTYDGLDHVLTMTADLPSGTNDQVTQYVYGVTSGGGNDITSNDLLKEVRYPNTSTGAANSSDKEAYTYNAAGDVKTLTDRNGNVHTYSYDVLDRQTVDAVTTLGSGVDGTVRRNETGYNTQGLAYLFTNLGQDRTPTSITRGGVGNTTATVTLNSHGLAVGDSIQISGATQSAYNGTFTVASVTTNTFTYTMASDPGATASGTLVLRSVASQVQRSFNGLGQMITEYQEVSGLVNTGTSAKVQYTYSEMASGANHSRLTSMVYPSGRTISYGYADTTLNDSISRLGQITDGSTTLESYNYLGLSTVVERNHPEPGLNLTYISTGTADAGDKYVGLDRFGRVVDQRWVDVAGAGGTTDRNADRFQYTYDRDSNRTTRAWGAFNAPSAGGLDEAYSYDNLNRLTKLNRGNLASGNITDANAMYAQQWDNTGGTGSGLDALGNWKKITTDTNGGTAGGATTITHTVNSQNQITAVTSGTSPTYDAAGDMTTDETGSKYTYDAWGHTIKVQTSGSVDKATFTIDPLGRRSVFTKGSAGVGASTRYYFSNQWQTIEERELNGSTWQAKYQTVFSPVYIDAVVERDNLDWTAAGSLDTSFDSDGKYTKSLTAGVDFLRYVQQQDGKLIGAGGAGSHIGLIRLNTDGTLDSTFDGPGGSGNGVFTITIGTSDQIYGIAVQNDGKIVLVGTSDNDVLMMRLNSDGSYDTAFDGPSGTGNGKFKLDYSGATDVGWSVALQSDGKIVFSGVSGGDVLVGRLTTTGAYDTSFDTDGWRKDNLTGTDRGLKVAIDHNGQIVVAGDTTAGTGGDIAIERYNSSDGSLDTSFDTDGKLTTSLSAGQDTARGLAIDDQNRILIAAYGDGNLDAVRYTQSGGLDTSFDTDGKVSIDINGTDQAESILQDASGRILLSGSSNSQKDFAIARLTSAGALDTSFDTDGKQTVSFSGNSAASEIGYTMLIQPTDGRIVLAGLSDVDVAVARLSGGGIRSYLVQDANYNVTATADATGTIVDRYQYEAYGKVTTLNPDFSTDLDGQGEVYQAYYFQGLRYEGNSGNYHARNRDLRPTLGKFTQEDPLGYPDGANRYAFAVSTPMSATGFEHIVHTNVMLIERIESARIATKTTIEVTVRVSYWRVEGDIRDGKCDDPKKTPNEGKEWGEKIVTLSATRGKNVTDENVMQFVEEAILPELPAWKFSVEDAVLAAAGPNNFYPLTDNGFSWVPRTKSRPRRYEAPNTGAKR